MKKHAAILVDELIGCEVAVLRSTNPCNTGIKGTIIDETKNTLTLETEKKEKKVLIKSQNTFMIKDMTINGSDLQGRPEERIKKWLKPRKKRRISELK